MHEDLRRRALESKKTVSKRSKTKQSSSVISAASSLASSRAASAANSKDNSRNPSRDVSRQGSEAGSDDNSVDDIFSETGFSLDSEDSDTDKEDISDVSLSELHHRIENIIGRSRRKQDEREQDLRLFTEISRHLFVQEQIADKLKSLCSSLHKAILSGSSEKEQIAALKALQVTILTDQSYNYDEEFGPSLRSLVETEQPTLVKVETLRLLALIYYFCNESEEDSEEIMDFLLEIVSSDGAFVDSLDDGAVVTAATYAWTFLATQTDDMEQVSQDIIETFSEQLESADPSVQVSAGTAIALLYEKSYTPIEEDDDVSEGEDGDKPNMIKRYEPFRRKDQLLQHLTALTRLSPKSLSKKTRRMLHQSFSDILRTVSDPLAGPQFRKRVRISEDTSMKVDAWWKLVVIDELKRVLQGGFLEHYRSNKIILENVSTLATSTQSYDKSERPRKGKFQREDRSMALLSDDN